MFLKRGSAARLRGGHIPASTAQRENLGDSLEVHEITNSTVFGPNAVHGARYILYLPDTYALLEKET